MTMTMALACLVRIGREPAQFLPMRQCDMNVVILMEVHVHSGDPYWLQGTRLIRIARPRIYVPSVMRCYPFLLVSLLEYHQRMMCSVETHYCLFRYIRFLPLPELMHCFRSLSLYHHSSNLDTSRVIMYLVQ